MRASSHREMKLVQSCGNATEILPDRSSYGRIDYAQLQDLQRWERSKTQNVRREISTEAPVVELIYRAVTCRNQREIQREKIVELAEDAIETREHGMVFGFRAARAPFMADQRGDCNVFYIPKR